MVRLQWRESGADTARAQPGKRDVILGVCCADSATPKGVFAAPSPWHPSARPPNVGQGLYGAKPGPILLGPLTGSADAACPTGVNPAPSGVQTAVSGSFLFPARPQPADRGLGSRVLGPSCMLHAARASPLPLPLLLRYRRC